MKETKEVVKENRKKELQEKTKGMGQVVILGWLFILLMGLFIIGSIITQ